jgi:hypothetical protein
VQSSKKETAMARPRPALVTAFGILNIIFGALFLFCDFGGALSSMSTTWTINGQDVTEHFQAHMRWQVPAYTTVRIIDLIVSLILAIGFIVAGVGVLRLAAWGRILAVVLAGLSVFHQLTMTFWQIAWIGPARTAFLNTVPGIGFGFLAGMETVRIVIWAILVLLQDCGIVAVLFTSSASQAFRRRGAGDVEERLRRKARRYPQHSTLEEENSEPSRRRNDNRESKPRRTSP